MRSAVIFDIDGTLLYARGVGRAAFGRAFLAAFGVPYPDLAGLSFVGATDSAVVRGMAAACGVPATPAREEHFFLRLACEIDTALTQNPPHVYPGVPALLEALAARGCPLGLITGNIRPTAWCKLRHAGLDAAFSFGAYGDDHPNRNDIARLAVARAPADTRVCLLVGDTPLDVRAAHANGLPVVAVATGWVSVEELAAAGADLVLADFSDTAACLRQLEPFL